MKEHIIMVNGQLGGIFDPSIKYIFDSENGIDLIGSWLIDEQENAITSVTKTNNALVFTNTCTTSSNCFGYPYNEIPINIRSYNYVNIELTSNYKYVSTSDVAQYFRLVTVINPNVNGTPHNGTWLDGNTYTFTTNTTTKAYRFDVSGYKGGTFRINLRIPPKGSTLTITKVYLSHD